MKRSTDFSIVKHILLKYGFNEIGDNNSSITYFQNDKGIKTSFIDREQHFSKKYLIELTDQLKLDYDTFIDTYNLIKEMVDKKFK